MHMRSSPLPYLLEDRSAHPTSSDFDDIYDRLFLRIAEASRDTESTVTMIYDMGRRSARKRDSRHYDRPPSAVLEFGTDGALGHIRLMQPPALLSLPMNQYLRKTAIWGG
ncbi:hypothetical protein HWV62_15283 [Athelia sp. TMB]|nr:hypothetical protein HWV62_31889 [Athelia sp. TMB]KAF7984307.1 hypothetical protein HWV62_15283 [Athelia sp. TMB]